MNHSHFLTFYVILIFVSMRARICRFDRKDNIIYDSRQYKRHAQLKLQTGSVLKLLRQIVLICNMHCSLIFYDIARAVPWKEGTTCYQERRGRLRHIRSEWLCKITQICPFEIVCNHKLCRQHFIVSQTF